MRSMRHGKGIHAWGTCALISAVLHGQEVNRQTCLKISGVASPSQSSQNYHITVMAGHSLTFDYAGLRFTRPGNDIMNTVTYVKRVLTDNLL